MTPTPSSGTPCLSVVMPCFNEEATVRQCLEIVLNQAIVGEVIVVDDASTDNTRDEILSVRDDRVRLVSHEKNRGKGASLRTGFHHTSLPFVIVQDADLEYDPREYGRVVAPLLDGRADVVFGSRFMGGDAHRVLFFWHYLGNRFLTLMSNMFTNLNLTDMETCYKAFRRDVLSSLDIQENRFGIEPEITAKIAAAGWKVFEVGISYNGRTYAEGKKIGWRDGFRALWCIVKYRPRR